MPINRRRCLYAYILSSTPFLAYCLFSELYMTFPPTLHLPFKNSTARCAVRIYIHCVQHCTLFTMYRVLSPKTCMFKTKKQACSARDLIRIYICRFKKYTYIVLIVKVPRLTLLEINQPFFSVLITCIMFWAESMGSVAYSMYEYI